MCLMTVSCYDAGQVLGSGRVEEQIQALYDALQEQNKKKLPVSLSKIDTNTWQEVQHTAQLTIRIVDNLPASRSKKEVDAFAWDDRIETAQSDRCNDLVLVITLSLPLVPSSATFFNVMELFDHNQQPLQPRKSHSKKGRSGTSSTCS